MGPTRDFFTNFLAFPASGREWQRAQPCLRDLATALRTVAIGTLLEPTEGEITFQGVDVVKLGSRQLKELRRDMQIVFQDSVGSLDPRMKV